MKLPKTLFICVREAGTENEFFLPCTDVDEFENGELVGEYTLTTLNRKRVIHQFDTAVTRRKK